MYSTEDLVQFHYQLLSHLLQRVSNQRTSEGRSHVDKSHLRHRFELTKSDSRILDELTEVLEVEDTMICLSSDSSDSAGDTDDDSMSPLSKAVKEQLKEFVSRVAQSYHPTNPFHCFEHASHVTFSAYQLLRSVVANDLPKSTMDCEMTNAWSHLPLLCSNTGAWGLSSDPLAQFAIIFSALIHDVEHVGVPNAQLAKEKPGVAAKYQNRSLAEQTSLDVAWALLHEAQFHDLRECIFPSQREFTRFRALVVNIVMSTDIADTALRAFNNRKWEKAFGHNTMDQEMESRLPAEERNRKATVLMDLIMMASDVSHTMQSFDVFTEWNERLFREMFAAYQDGRACNDPSESWYLAEMMFFDKHIIPLAKRLADSGMFGPTAFMLLQNAQDNRREWEIRGQQILQDMQERLQVLRPEVASAQASVIKVSVSKKRRLGSFITCFGMVVLGLFMRRLVQEKNAAILPSLEPVTKKIKMSNVVEMPDIFRLAG